MPENPQTPIPGMVAVVTIASIAKVLQLTLEWRFYLANRNT